MAETMPGTGIARTGKAMEKTVRTVARRDREAINAAVKARVVVRREAGITSAVIRKTARSGSVMVVTAVAVTVCLSGLKKARAALTGLSRNRKIPASATAKRMIRIRPAVTAGAQRRK